MGWENRRVGRQKVKQKIAQCWINFQFFNSSDFIIVFDRSPIMSWAQVLISRERSTVKHRQNVDDDEFAREWA